MRDDQIDTTDVPALGPRFFARAKLRSPIATVQVEVPIDADLLAWFKALGPEWERRLNAALRLYAEAHREPEPPSHARSAVPTAPIT